MPTIGKGVSFRGAGRSGASRKARPRRFRVDALVTMNADCDPFEVTVCDVSETGLRIRTDRDIEPGPITVKMIGFPIFSGEVRWQRAGKVGISLSNPIPQPFLSVWLQYHGSRRRGVAASEGSGVGRPRLQQDQ